MVVSYAQNFEDVMLRRALGLVEQGFYIDVGAWSPDNDSVTRMFYDAGWRGVNVEPLPAMLAELQARRPRDVNLGLAVSDSCGTAQFHNIADTGMSTLGAAEAVRARDFIGSETVLEVQVVTLSQLWDDHVPAGQEVHFLKIDVEGAEGQVIRGADWQRHRPWIVVVEATVPQSPEPSHHGWDPLLQAAGYDFVWFDGLNRFYLAREHAVLAGAFQTPPNVFDGFELALPVELARRLARSEALVRQLQERLDAGPLDGLRKAVHRAMGRCKAAVRRILPQRLATLADLSEAESVPLAGLSPQAVAVARRIAALRSRQTGR